MIWLTWVALAVAAIMAWYTRPARRVRHLPQVPASSWINGNISEFLRFGELACEKAWASIYGHVCVFRLGREPSVLVSDAELAKEIMTNGTVWTIRPDFRMIFRPPDNILWANGSRWKFLRNATLPCFQPSKLAGFGPLMNRCAKDIEDVFEKAADSSTVVDMVKWYKGMTLDVIGSAAFGQEFHTVAGPGCPISGAAGTLMKLHHARANTYWLTFLSSVVRLPKPFARFMPSFKPVVKHVRVLEKWIEDTIVDRQSDVSKAKHDFLTLMVEAVDPQTHKGLTLKQIQENSRLFLFAGHETTALSLALVMFHLAANPDVKQKVFDEVDSLKSKEAVETVDEHEYLGWVINESMRMCSVVPVVGRAPVCDTVIGNGRYVIPAGTTVLISCENIHHEPKYWEEPEAFRPERFDPASKEAQQRHKFAFLPFGGGPRQCIGMRFALLEMKVTLIRILRRFDFAVDEKTIVPLKTQFFITLNFPDGIHFRVCRRRGVTA
ncbi:unnamed protein product (mitochondrion) [Plasmodiophora brassicae]|uniref:Cytochrome P450 n=1 Tax=Plasmodiophora brassicae TaxID=37360 RepID=A0A3P3Y3Q0_PLABS|nr:unnamed protein product [Plasmodiophora brassicae]